MLFGEFLTSNANIAWPFYSDTPAIDTAVVRMFADGGAILQTNEIGMSVFVGNISASTSRISFNVEKVDSSGRVVDRVDFSSSLSDEEYTQLRQPWCFFIIDNKHVADSAGLVFGDRLQLDPSAVDVVADKITSLTLINQDGTSPNTHPIVGDVKVLEGYNISLATATNEALGSAGAILGTYMTMFELQGYSVTGFSIAAGPGLGKGAVPCDDPPDCSGTFGNLVADSDGSIVIDADGCFHVAAQTIGGKKVVMLTGRCTPCCQCDEYVDTGNRLASQSVKTKNVKDRLLSDTAAYNVAVKAYNEGV